jgi:hypothetical protein
MSNSTSTCPDFLENPFNVTSSYCALPLCGNNTAVMRNCCGNSDIVPYHYDPGFAYHGENETHGNALWCQVSDDLISAWGSCVGGYGTAGMCSGSQFVSKGGACGGIERSMGVVFGAFSIVVLLQSIF